QARCQFRGRGMKWRLLAAYAAMVVSGAGCSWLGPRWALPDSSPPSKTDSPAPSVTRSQQPEAEAGRPTPNAPPAEEPPAPPSGQGFITCRIRAIVNGKPILDDELR